MGPFFFVDPRELSRGSKSKFEAECGIKPAPFWPRVPRGEPKRTLDLKDLAAAVKNPWKFFLQKSLGIYLQKEPLFSDLRKEDFALPVYRKRDFLFAALTRPIDAVLKKKEHLLPPGVFGDRAQLELEAAEWKGRLGKWEIDPHRIHSIRFSSRCKESRPLKDGWIEVPSLKVDGIEIVGDLTGVAPSGLITEGKDSELLLALRHWPRLLVYLLYSGQKTVSLYSLEKETPCSWEIDAAPALRRFIAYQEKVEESLSPLIKPWAAAFLKDGFTEWSQKAHETLAKEEDRWIRWVALRATPCPLEAIWNEWNPIIRETFQEIL
jgi:exonuclease V gamma subunit